MFYLGENLMPEEEGFLGDFMIDIEPMPMHESKIEIAFRMPILAM